MMNENQEFNFLDALTMVGFFAQLSNMSEDEAQTDYIRKVILAISQEIEKLHQENDVIIKQNEEILNILNKEKNESRIEQKIREELNNG
jgi:predicted patatin/cPLA2 family phospholipase